MDVVYGYTIGAIVYNYSFLCDPRHASPSGVAYYPQAPRILKCVRPHNG